MDGLDRPTAGLVRLAAAIARGEPARVEAAATAAREAGVPVLWGDELLLQSALMVGYPRTLAGAVEWRRVAGPPAEGAEDGTDFSQIADWLARGESTCRVVYGANYAKLRSNVAGLHPALDAWMVSEGYGRTLSRPGLDLVRREFCVIAQVTVLEAERQLHSHLRGALHAGAGRVAIAAVLDLTATEASGSAMTTARRVWERVAG